MFKLRLSHLYILLIFITPLSLSAHGFGESFEKKDGENLIDIGYSVTEFREDESVVFDFEIKDPDDQEMPFSDVWVRIIEGKKTVFASGIHNADFGGAIMTYVFPNTGDYELSVRFQDDGEKIAEAVFPLTVLEGEQREPAGTSRATLFIMLVIGFVLGALLGVFMLRKLV